MNSSSYFEISSTPCTSTVMGSKLSSTSTAITNETMFCKTGTINHILCYGASSIGGIVILLILFSCCFCCYSCRRRQKRRGSGTQQSGTEAEQQQANPIDLATGQLSGQHELKAENSSTSSFIEKKTKTTFVKSQSDIQKKTPTLVAIKSNEKVTSTSVNPPTMTVPRSHTYERLDAEGGENNFDDEEPNYDTIETVMDNMQAPGEHKYHVLCGPSNSKIPESKEGPGYEEVTNSGMNADISKSKDGYDVLDSGIQPNLFQKGVVQEDANSPNEDKYYSLTRGHKLVPVGRRRSQNTDSHLYEALSQEGRPQPNDYNKIQLRHNTFSSLTNLEKQTKSAAVRTQRATSTSMEKLDPMYDEPFLTEPASEMSKQSLFDDPKYASKDDPSGREGRHQREQEMGERKAASRKTH